MENNQQTNDKKIVLQIFAGVFAFIYAYYFFKDFFPGIKNLFYAVTHVGYTGVFGLIVRLIMAVLRIATGVAELGAAAFLVYTIIKWTSRKAISLYVTFSEIAVVQFALVLVQGILRVFFNILPIRYRASFGFKGIITMLVVDVIAIALYYGILYLMNITINFATAKDLLLSAPKEAFGDMQQFAQEKQAEAQSKAYEAEAGEVIYNQNGQQGKCPRKLKTDRNTLLYAILVYITCWIYQYVWIYGVARDVNILCEDDGDHSSGLIKFIIFNILTCGIYSIVWLYKIGNRIQLNAKRYNVEVTENGTSVLLWMILGYFTCGICYFLSINVINKNLNKLSIAYNARL